MEKKPTLKPRIIVYGVDETVRLMNPHVLINDAQKWFEISYIVPTGVNYCDFKFLPLGNEFVIYFNEEEIFRKRIAMWIDPASVSSTYKQVGSFLIFKGKLVLYDPEIRLNE